MKTQACLKQAANMFIFSTWRVFDSVASQGHKQNPEELQILSPRYRF